MAPRETVNNAYAKFCVDKQRALWYVMVFLEWSIIGTPGTMIFFRRAHTKKKKHKIKKEKEKEKKRKRNSYILRVSLLKQTRLVKIHLGFLVFPLA